MQPTYLLKKPNAPFVHCCRSLALGEDPWYCFFGWSCELGSLPPSHDCRRLFSFACPCLCCKNSIHSSVPRQHNLPASVKHGPQGPDQAQATLQGHPKAPVIPSFIEYSKPMAGRSKFSACVAVHFRDRRLPTMVTHAWEDVALTSAYGMGQPIGSCRCL